MASLYIKDGETADRVSRLAARLGVSKTEAVRRAVAALEGQDTAAENPELARAYIAEFHQRFPPLERTGLKADKAFFDELWGEVD